MQRLHARQFRGEIVKVDYEDFESFKRMLYAGNVTLPKNPALLEEIKNLQLFGGKMGKGEDLPRSNFDEIFVACITTFQVLTEDAWEKVMFNAMTGAGPAVALFFVALIIIAAGFSAGSISGQILARFRS
jgi:hypothetical protein